MQPQGKRSLWKWSYVLLLIQYVAMLWVPYYNSAEPSLAGIPFFYWYQMLWVLIGAALTGIVYLVSAGQDEAAQDPPGPGAV
jgi:hypothetical protein